MNNVILIMEPNLYLLIDEDGNTYKEVVVGDYFYIVKNEKVVKKIKIK